MDAIEITAHFNLDGIITPISFVWKGRTYRVEGTGRRWNAKDGHHLLVMAAGNRAYHLTFNYQTGIWYLVHGGEHPTVQQA